MSLPLKFERTLLGLLCSSGTLCFGWYFGLAFALIWFLCANVQKKVQWHGIPPRFSQPILTLLCFGYLIFLGFWGNFVQFTGLPRLAPEEAFWLFNLYTFAIEVFLIFSQKNDSIRTFLSLVAVEQTISGLIFYPNLLTFFLLLLTFALLLRVLNLRADLLQMQAAFQFEMKCTCESFMQKYALPERNSSHAEGPFHQRKSWAFNRIPVKLGPAGEDEIRRKLSNYPIQVEKRSHSLNFKPETDSPKFWTALEERFFPASTLPRSSVHLYLPGFGKIACWLTFSLAFAFFFFLTVYRSEHFRSGNFGLVLPSSIGYSESSRLGDFGPQMGNPKPYLWLRLFRDEKGMLQWKKPLKEEELNLSEAPLYLRGSVFDRYENAGWTTSESMDGVNPTAFRAKGSQKSDLYLTPRIWQMKGLIRMEEKFEPVFDSAFFPIWPFCLPPAEYDSPTQFASNREKVLFNSGEPRPGTPYSLLSCGFLLQDSDSNTNTNTDLDSDLDSAEISSSDSVEFAERLNPNAPFKITQSRWTPAFRTLKNPEFLRKPNPETFPSLCALAASWENEIFQEQANSKMDDFRFEPFGKHGTPTLAVAEGFCERLAHSSKFSYSTSPVRRERGLDPLEDFIRNHPTGHCEFYASALVQMLRSVGIPARYVVGFAAQEFSPTAGAWVVRHQDAHAWVEAWIPPDEIPEEIFRLSPVPSRYWQRGAWLRLDPTSQRRLPDREASHGPLFRLTDTLNTFWKNYFLNLNFQTQQERIYAPASQLKKRLREVCRSILPAFQKSLPFAVVLLLGLTVFWCGWKCRKIFRKSTFGRRKRYSFAGESSASAKDALGELESLAVRRQHSVIFYRNLEKELEKVGLKREHGETSLEFTRRAEAFLHRGDLVALTRKYYALRFGKSARGESQGTSGEV